MRRAAVASGAIAWALLLVGLALQVLLTPGFTRALVTRVGSTELTGLTQTRTLELAEEVRAYVTSNDAAALPATVDSRDGFDERQAHHLDDVRGVMRAASALTWALLAGALVWCAAALRGHESSRGLLRDALLGSGAILIVTLVLAGLSGLADFDALFARFHGLFFDAGSWKFYETDLIIELFPERFWIVAGGAWALLVASFGLSAALCARAMDAARDNAAGMTKNTRGMTSG
ncbi:MAG: DUF1461 domain-containing protein [Coriobacteriia bacterium]|nr:DUF1461 domain-containing protein [Coriobacteriia bacterium]